jgi:hypothetical protein
MEIVLIVALVVVAAGGLSVATTFNRRTRQTTAPLIENAVSNISEQIKATADDLRRQLQAITDDLHADREQQRLEGRKIQGRLDHADSLISGMASRFLGELDAIKRRDRQFGERQDQMSADLQRLAARVPGGEPGSPQTSDGVTAARPAVVAGRLYAERLQFSLVRPPGSDRVRIAVERSVGELPPGLLGDRGDDGFRERLAEAAPGYAATRWGDPAFAVTAGRWITQNRYPETAAAEACNRIGAGLSTLVTRPLDAIGSEIRLRAPVAATAAGIGADLVLQPVTGPLEQAAAFFEIVGVVAGVAAGFHPLVLATAKLLARDRFHQLLARGISDAARQVFTGPGSPAESLEPVRPVPASPTISAPSASRPATAPPPSRPPDPDDPTWPSGPAIGGPGSG